MLRQVVGIVKMVILIGYDVGIPERLAALSLVSTLLTLASGLQAVVTYSQKNNIFFLPQNRHNG